MQLTAFFFGSTMFARTLNLHAIQEADAEGKGARV
jgi:hypothetical protein